MREAPFPFATAVPFNVHAYVKLLSPLPPTVDTSVAEAPAHTFVGLVIFVMLGLSLIVTCAFPLVVVPQLLVATKV